MGNRITQTADENRINNVPLYTPKLSANMPLEDVFKYYGNEERNRTEDTLPKNKSSVRVHIRNAPDELASSLGLIVNKISKYSKIATLNILTKCMSRHLLRWYIEILEIDQIAEEYQILFEEAKKGHGVIRKQLENASFEFYKAAERVDVHLEIPNFVIGALAAWSIPLGASSSQLLVEGMAWSLTTLTHREWDEHNINFHFLPEVEHMEKMVKFRRIELKGFKQKLEIDK